MHFAFSVSAVSMLCMGLELHFTLLCILPNNTGCEISYELISRLHFVRQGLWLQRFSLYLWGWPIQKLALVYLGPRRS